MKIRTSLVAAAAAVLLLAGCGSPPVNTGSVSPASGGAPASAAAADAKKPPTWGERYTWPNGVAIEVTQPAGCKPGQYAQPPNIERAVTLQVTVTNGSDKPFDATLLSTAQAQFGGAHADAVFDSNGKCKNSTMNGAATVLPGKTLKLDMSFAVGKDPGELQIELQPDFVGDKAVFVGQA
ncbi:hypothetical protein [Amycolatopsis plumensis]|uniref:DUF4352 domain-containing protein n=1 Tax=Amycolatopsis plumensis TaxID=236508 RepID=A0ABV5UAH7_9PSEU